MCLSESVSTCVCTFVVKMCATVGVCAHVSVCDRTYNFPTLGKIRSRRKIQFLTQEVSSLSCVAVAPLGAPKFQKFPVRLVSPAGHSAIHMCIGMVDPHLSPRQKLNSKERGHGLTHLFPGVEAGSWKTWHCVYHYLSRILIQPDTLRTRHPAESRHGNTSRHMHSSCRFVRTTYPLVEVIERKSKPANVSHAYLWGTKVSARSLTLQNTPHPFWFHQPPPQHGSRFWSGMTLGPRWKVCLVDLPS